MEQKLSNAAYLGGLAGSYKASDPAQVCGDSSKLEVANLLLLAPWFHIPNAFNGGYIQRKQLQNVPKDFSSKNSDFYFKGPFCEISLLFVTLQTES